MTSALELIGAIIFFGLLITLGIVFVVIMWVGDKL